MTSSVTIQDGDQFALNDVMASSYKMIYNNTNKPMRGNSLSTRNVMMAHITIRLGSVLTPNGGLRVKPKLVIFVKFAFQKPVAMATRKIIIINPIFFLIVANNILGNLTKLYCSSISLLGAIGDQCCRGHFYPPPPRLDNGGVTNTQARREK